MAHLEIKRWRCRGRSTFRWCYDATPTGMGRQLRSPNPDCSPREDGVFVWARPRRRTRLVASRFLLRCTFELRASRGLCSGTTPGRSLTDGAAQPRQVRHAQGALSDGDRRPPGGPTHRRHRVSRTAPRSRSGSAPWRSASAATRADAGVQRLDPRAHAAGSAGPRDRGGRREPLRRWKRPCTGMACGSTTATTARMRRRRRSPSADRFQYRLRSPTPGVYWYHPHLREDYAPGVGTLRHHRRGPAPIPATGRPPTARWCSRSTTSSSRTAASPRSIAAGDARRHGPVRERAARERRQLCATLPYAAARWCGSS